MFPSAVIKDDQNPRTPLGLWVGDIAIETLNRTSEIFRSPIFSIGSIETAEG
jgi:hypothetical protein